MSEPRKELHEQIAELADARFDPKLSDFSELTETFRKSVRSRERPTVSGLVLTVFSELGVQAPNGYLENYITSFLEDFDDEVHGLTLAERRKLFRGHIALDASIRQSFINIREAYEEFHGETLAVELTNAECLGYFVIEQSLILAEPSSFNPNGHDVPKSA